MSQTVQMVLISAIAGLLAASVVYALWGIVVAIIKRSHTPAATEGPAPPEVDSDDQRADQAD